MAGSELRRLVLEPIAELQVSRRPDDYNTNNHYHHWPFRATIPTTEEPLPQRTVVVYTEWYEALPQSTRDNIDKVAKALNVELDLVDAETMIAARLATEPPPPPQTEGEEGSEEEGADGGGDGDDVAEDSGATTGGDNNDASGSNAVDTETSADNDCGNEYKYTAPTLKDDIYLCLYKAVLYNYDYGFWGGQLGDFIAKPPVLYTFTTDEVHYLKELSSVRTLTGRPLSDNDVEDAPPGLMKRLQECLDQVTELAGRKVPAFAKLGSTSGKNGRPLVPLVTARDVLNFLTNCDQLLIQVYECTDKYHFHRDVVLVLMEWVEDMDPGREFRVFVRDGVAVAMAQQKWYHNFKFNHDQLKTIATAIDATVSKMAGAMPFASSVVDMFVDDSDRGHLIECNPWGAPFSSGSSLFHWEKDLSLLDARDYDLWVAEAQVRGVEPPTWHGSGDDGIGDGDGGRAVVVRFLDCYTASHVIEL